MPSICLYFQIHQPCRLRHYTFFDIGQEHQYEDNDQNRAILARVAEKCYLPANAVLLDLLDTYQGAFKLAYSISGVALDQFEQFRPDVIDSFKRLAATGCVEFLNETYYHSLAFNFSLPEFRAQVALHRQKIQSLFGQTATAFRNTELVYSNTVAREVEKLGYSVVLAEGADRILGTRTPNAVYRPEGCETLRLLLKNYRLSDDIAFRFSDRNGADYPLTAATFAARLHQCDDDALVNLFMDFETFGEHHWADTGIFDFLKLLPHHVLVQPESCFRTPTEAALQSIPASTLSVPLFTSWADAERDLTAWLGNDMQNDAVRALYELEPRVLACGRPDLLATWRRLQTSDHFYYMCTKWLADGDVHTYFNPYRSPYDAYINYMNILTDFSEQVTKA